MGRGEGLWGYGATGHPIPSWRAGIVPGEIPSWLWGRMVVPHSYGGFLAGLNLPGI